jgi:hypothetical protein
MDIILAGKFETAMVRGIDEVLHPSRNASGNTYYVGLNRKVDHSYFERCGTFISIADSIKVPGIDWNFAYSAEQQGPLRDLDLGIKNTPAGGREWNDDTRAFVKVILSTPALSKDSLNYISALKFSHYDPEDRQQLEADLERLTSKVADHYLNRLFLQVKAARESGALLVMSEEDIQILHEVGRYMSSNRSPTPFDLPDLTGKVIEPNSFCSGLLNFCPRDIMSVGAVKADPGVREYASKIGSLLSTASSDRTQDQMLTAMIHAFEKSEAGSKAEKVFEVTSWLVKPLHYVPVVGEILGAVEDIKDVGIKWLRRERANQDWCLLGVRMADIAIKDYLRRKGNQIGYM